LLLHPLTPKVHNGRWMLDNHCRQGRLLHH
jgi:hypothetical protein